MENNLKQRIIGALVLIGLAVIFLPNILKEKKTPQKFVSNIPQKPKEFQQSVTINLRDYDTAKAEFQQSYADYKHSRQQEKDDEVQPSVKPTIKQVEEIDVALPTQRVETIINEKRIKESKTVSDFQQASWIVQLASFSVKANAENLVNELKQKKNKAFYRQTSQSSGKNIYRVYIGPFIQRSEADKVATAVEPLVSSRPLIVTFDPAKH